jgi:hypothetical protein
MNKLFVLLLTVVTFFEVSHCEEKSNYFVDNFLKYSTFYTSVSIQSPFEPKQKFDFNQELGTFVETTEKVEGSYNVSFGIRKLARFKYQTKKANFYDGSEKNLSDVATIGGVSGWEYLIKFSAIRSFGEEFVDSESWVRYLGDNFVVKGSYANFGLRDLEFGQLDVRYRKPFGQYWNFTAGGNLRGHPAYGLFPFNEWLANSDGQWWNLAYNYGYEDEYYELEDGSGNYEWYDDSGTLVAETDDEFYEYYYGDLITLYNEEEVDKLGWQYESSVVLGVDFYLYEKKYWVHGWGSVMPISKGLTDNAFQYGRGDIDFDLGLVAGWKFNRNLGFFGEGRYLRYWGIDSYDVKVGVNYTVF